MHGYWERPLRIWLKSRPIHLCPCQVLKKNDFVSTSQLYKNLNWFFKKYYCFDFLSFLINLNKSKLIYLIYILYRVNFELILITINKYYNIIWYIFKLLHNSISFIQAIIKRTLSWHALRLFLVLFKKIYYKHMIIFI